MTEPTFGQKFRQARIKADLGQKEVGEKIGRSIATIRRIEADDPKLNERTRGRAEEWLASVSGGELT